MTVYWSFAGVNNLTKEGPIMPTFGKKLNNLRVNEYDYSLTEFGQLFKPHLSAQKIKALETSPNAKIDISYFKQLAQIDENHSLNYWIDDSIPMDNPDNANAMHSINTKLDELKQVILQQQNILIENAEDRGADWLRDTDIPHSLIDMLHSLFNNATHRQEPPIGPNIQPIFDPKTGMPLIRFDAFTDWLANVAEDLYLPNDCDFRQLSNKINNLKQKADTKHPIKPEQIKQLIDDLLPKNSDY